MLTATGSSHISFTNMECKVLFHCSK